MNHKPFSNLEEFQHFVDVCNHFEDALRKGLQPSIDKVLAKWPEPLRAHVQEALLDLEQHHRRRSDRSPIEGHRPEKPQVDEYPTTTPNDATPSDDSLPLPKTIGRYRVKGVLGIGAFGRVYLAQDDDLHRAVAIKVPLPERVTRPADIEAYLAEARILASLNHPHIIAVFDVGRTENGWCFVVSKFVEGTDLAKFLKESWPSLSDSARLVATVAEALHHAHRHGLVHRDVKPANILIDAAGTPILSDFGLAMKDADFGKGAGFAGTPAYMSPEQANGEGHRVDGRSDIFSLGVVFYELLTKNRPFMAETRDELLEKIAIVEAKPPRQIDDTIPKELERICLKALSKRAADRYTVAKDMADDLTHFLAEPPGKNLPMAVQNVSIHLSPNYSAPVPAATPPSSDNKPIKIVPKGLRSFDSHDADFFLDLLPGPRDRDGLPDSIRFWKTRIEEMDPDHTFSVGLIYGPSGCGKSSLVKAGLLPRLSHDVIAVYVEATAEETETRLLNGLRKRCPLAANLTLKETLGALRRGPGAPVGKKVLLVLDQFEQWLHAKKDQENTELVQALRQCDGAHLQAIVMVRDDFWMAATRFIRELEIRLVDGQNFAAVDLFPVRHAEKVLASFGRAFGCLPEKASEATSEQKQFLEKAVAALAQEGKVVSVRLALFAEMMKGKSWSVATLKAMGGAEGVGVTFLEETFSAANAPPEHRYHQKAARAVLRVLLPESGIDIKGHVRPREQLLETSGYGARPKDFDDLLRILDAETRLLTPTDPEGKVEGERMMEEKAKATVASSRSSLISPPSSLLFYQLTHDYLVPALRDWLTRKQKETRRGRTELLLADRSAVWNARSENRQLPSLLQWFQIRALTQKKNWTPPQQRIMRKATRYHAVRAAMVAVILALIGLGSWESFGRLEGRRFRDRLLEATTADVPGIIKEMAAYRRWVDPLLKDALAQAEKEKDSRKQLHVSLALLPTDSGQVDYLYRRLLKGDPQEVVVIRAGLLDQKADLTERLWTLLEDPKSGQDQRFRASCALSVFAPEDVRWEKASGDVAATLVIQKPFVIAQWTEALKDVGRWLIPQLADFLVDETRAVSERGSIANVYSIFAAAVPDAYARLGETLSEASAPTQFARTALAKRQASVGVALMAMGKSEKVWPLLKHKPDPTARSYLMGRLASGGVDPKDLINRWEAEQEVSVKRAILLSLGEYGLDRLSLAERRNHVTWLLKQYREDPDSGIHGAAEWLLRQWGETELLRATDGQIVMDQQPTLEQKERIAKFAKDIEDIEIANEKARGVRQASWEQKLRENPVPIPASLAEGLIAHFPLDETEGKEIANAIAGQPAARYLGKGIPDWIRGMVGGALRLNGSDTVAGRKPLNLEADRAFSYGCWFQYNANVPMYNANVYMTLLSTRDRTKGFRGFELGLGPNHQVHMQITGEDSKLSELERVSYSPFDLTVIATTSVNPAQRPGWHHVLVTYDGSKKAAGVRIFVDGEAQPTRIFNDRFAGTILSGTPVYIGSRHGDFQFSGALDDVRIYDRCLSETEARQVYEPGVHALARIPAEYRDPQQRHLVADYFRSQDESLQRLTKQQNESLQRLIKQLAAARLAGAQELVRKIGIAGGRQWYVNGAGQTMVVVPMAGKFWMGMGPERHQRTIDRRFAIATKEVTMDEFLRSRLVPGYYKEYADCPMSVTWYLAVEYCNWLSEQEGIPKEQWCYEPNEAGQYAEGMKMAVNYLKRTGYRLPMEEEWEYICRAGGDTWYSFGEPPDLLGKFGWNLANSLGKSKPVGLLKPNDLGVFDMHGNASEWCQDAYGDYRKGGDGKATTEEKAREIIKDKISRVLRGGSYSEQELFAGSAYRRSYKPASRIPSNGFRVARTLPLGSSTAVQPTAEEGAGLAGVIDPDGDCQIKTEKGGVSILVPGTHHAYASELQRWNAPRVLERAAGDFVVRVTVSGEFEPGSRSAVPGRVSYNGAGLLVIADPMNHVSLQRAVLPVKSGLRHYLNFEHRKDGKLSVSRSQIELQKKDTILELKRLGDQFHARASHDGMNWKSYDPINAQFPERVLAGVLAVNSSSQPFRCKFEGYRLTTMPKSD